MYGSALLAGCKADPRAAGNEDPSCRDFDLKRGIWIRGRVIDKETGQPRQAMLDYFLFGNNPHASEVPETSTAASV